MKKPTLCGYSVNDILDLISPDGYNYSHALRIANSIYKKRITEFSQITNFPKKLKEFLSSAFTVSPGGRIERRHRHG